MDSPENNVEMIMKVFSRFSDKCIQDLAPPEYNAVYSHVSKCLLEIYEQLQQRLATVEAERDQALKNNGLLGIQVVDLMAERNRLKAENDRLEGECENWKDSFERLTKNYEE